MLKIAGTVLTAVATLATFNDCDHVLGVHMSPHAIIYTLLVALGCLVFGADAKIERK